MAIPKTIGIETEYGIIHRGEQALSHSEASCALVNAYLFAGKNQNSTSDNLVNWDYAGETPQLDARAPIPEDNNSVGIESQLVSTVLTNGARYYVDHSHPEISTPECADARSVVLYDRASDLIAQRSMTAVNKALPEGEEIILYKNNSDGIGHSYGCHENYLVDRNTPFGRIARHCISHFVSRQIYAGAGKVGSELPGERTDEVFFQLTQRADFFEEEVGLETTLRRPIVNTRDEPHADLRKYRRLHVIVGDANISQVATFLKVGTTALLLGLVEDDALHDRFALVRPLEALRQTSRDLDLNQTLELLDNTTITALEMQWDLFDQCKKYVEERGTDNVGGEVGLEVLDRWESVLNGLETDPKSLATQLDWVAKYRLISAYRERHGLSWHNPRLRALDIQYHDLRPENSLAARLGLVCLVDDSDAAKATTQPPTDTRAYIRGRSLQKYPNEVVSANWDSLIFTLGGDNLRRLPLQDPLKGTKAHLGSIIDECETAAELLRRIAV